MKKFSIVVTACLATFSLMAQSTDDVNKLLGNEKYAEARTAIDKHMADPKNAGKSESWYFKGRTYNAYSYDKTLSATDKLNLKSDAFDAFKKAQELDKNDMRMKLENYGSYLDLYAALYEVGANSFNSKEYENALNSFKKAMEVEKYILAKGYSYKDVKLNALDTPLVLNAAVAAMQAKKEDESVGFYRQLTDANVSGPDYKDIYEYLVDYYFKKEDKANLDVMLPKAKTLYPENEFWTDIEIEAVKKSGDKAALFAKYDELISKNTTSFLLPYNYSIEQYNLLYVGDEKPANAEVAIAKLTETLNKAIANDKGIDATFLMTKHLYQVSSDQSVEITKIKGTKPEDVKKKADLTAKAKASMNEFLGYGDKVIAFYEPQAATLKPVQKATYKELLTNMSEVYTYLKNTAKAAEIDKKKAAL
ncbi:MAG TPA: hypothetical protein PKU77_08800 [Ferruginibacter sp.]|nr:hypothetical protein [Ferruginibacter sp.]